MIAFFGGIVSGCLFMGAAFAIFLNYRAPRRDIAEWSEATYQKPAVTTRILIHERHMEL
jgi:hypothetical protein